MEDLGQYLLSVLVSAIICALAKSVSNEKTVPGAMIRLAAGIIMATAVLSPLLTLNPADLPAISKDIAQEADAAVTEGKEMAEQEMRSIIIERVEAYILDKAASFGAVLDVEVLMASDGSNQPAGVILSGSISPYAKSQLQSIIAEDIQIAKEYQQWIS